MGGWYCRLGAEVSNPEDGNVTGELPGFRYKNFACVKTYKRFIKLIQINVKFAQGNSYVNRHVQQDWFVIITF